MFTDTDGKRKNVDFYDEAYDGVSFIEGGLTRAKGVRATGVHAGFRKNSSKNDLALVVVPEGSVAAGVFTTNKFCAAPVQVDREKLKSGHARAVVLNSGIANAATGTVGLENARKTAQIVAKTTGVGEGEVLVASTGVIGVQLDMEKFESGVPQAFDALGKDDGTDIQSGLEAASAIMTTDTVSKTAAVEFTATQSDGVQVTYHIGGMSKGSGMIEPNMATMLAVVATDCMIEPEAAQKAIKEAADVSFNRITVDSDMSTNDSLILLATGAVPGKTLTTDCPVYPLFVGALKTVCCCLAKQMAADGEGASKLVTVRVTGAASDEEAKIAAKSVANSPLVKTAIAGRDANWGRISAALGKSSAMFNQEDVSITFMGIPVMKGGLPLEFDESEASRRFENDEITIECDLGNGNGSSRVWTCDLTHDYITINGDYRT